MNNILKENYTYNNYTDKLILLKGILEKIDKFITGTDYIIGLNKQFKNIYVFGSNHFGQLGLGEKEHEVNSFKLLNLNIKIKKVSCGRNHTLLLSDNNEIYSSGSNRYGQCGNNSNYDIFKFTLLSKRNVFINKIYCCDYTSFAITKDNKLYGWGSNENGLLLIDYEEDYKNYILDYKEDHKNYILKPSFLLYNIKKLYTGYDFLYSLSTNNELYAWGDNSYDKINNTTYEFINKPFKINFNESIKKISCGYDHILILTDNNKIYSKGNNNKNQLGYITNNKDYSEEFIQIKDLKDNTITNIYINKDNSYITCNNKVYLFGEDNDNKSIILGEKTLNFELSNIKLYGKYTYIFIITEEHNRFLTSLLNYNGDYNLNVIFNNKIKRKDFF